MIGPGCALLASLIVSVEPFQVGTTIFYIQMIRTMEHRWQQAKELCETNGMSLPVFHYDYDFDIFVAARDIMITREGASRDSSQPWLGLRHDGSNDTLPANFQWIDGQTATFISAQPGDLDYDPESANATDNLCVRVFEDRMKLTSCTWRRDTVCQGTFQTLGVNGPRMYYAANKLNGTNTAATQFLPVTSDSQLPFYLGMRSLVTPPKDVIDCFQYCASQPICTVVAVLRDNSNCYIMI